MMRSGVCDQRRRHCCFGREGAKEASEADSTIVAWSVREQGPLGMSLRERSFDPYFRSYFTRYNRSEPEQPSLSETASGGRLTRSMAVTHLNGKSVAGVSYSALMEQLRACGRPIHFTFSEPNYITFTLFEGGQLCR